MDSPTLAPDERPHGPGCDPCLDAEAQVGQMQQAMASRAVIEQAKGMVMVVRGCTEDEAFAELVQTSRHTNQKLRDLATDLVTARGATLAG